MKKLLLTACSLAALVFCSAAGATASTTYSVSASSSHAAIVSWTTNRDGALTMTLSYKAKSAPVFNAWGVSPDGTPNTNLNGCSAASTATSTTYSCAVVPAGVYRVMIWPTKGTMTGSLTVTGETD